jgi:hypothetical protein
MKPINATTPRSVLTSLAGAIIATGLLWLGSATPASAVPQLSLVGGTGVPGGTVGVTLVLADDTGNVAVTSEVKITFPTDALEFFSPVGTNCVIDPRLAATHGVGGVTSAGLVHPNVFLSPIPPPPPPPYPRLGDGNVFTCDFRVLAGVPAGTVAVTLQNVCLGDTNGTCVETTTNPNGSVMIAAATFTPTVTPTLHPTSTNTPVGPTHTATPMATPINTKTATPTTTPPTGAATHTPTTTPTGSPINTGGMTPTNTAAATATATSTGGTPTVTPSAKATSTNTVAATRTTGNLHPKDSDSCSIVAPEQSSFTGTLALLLAPAVLVWARRRRF